MAGGGEGGVIPPAGGVMQDFSETFARFTKADKSIVENTDSTWVVLGTDPVSTITCDSGILIEAFTDTKISKKSATFAEKTGDYRIQLGKKLNGNKIIVPVAGNCTISFIFDSNKAPSENVRSLFATATAVGATVQGNGAAGTTAFYSITGTSPVQDYISFTYTGSAGLVEFECCSDATGASAGGSCYLYGIDVDYN